MDYNTRNGGQVPSPPGSFNTYTNSHLDMENQSYRSDAKEFDLFPPRRFSSDTIDIEKGVSVKVTELQHDPHAPLVSGINPPMPFGQRLRHFTWAWYV
jgi:hypothetical protein